MDDHNKRIELIGIKRTRPVLSQIRHQIDKWIEQERTLLFLSKASGYRVTISREENPAGYVCRIELSIGGSQWFGRDTAKTLQEAVDRTLHHMRRDPLIALQGSPCQRVSESVA